MQITVEVDTSINWHATINKRIQRLIDELDKHRPLGTNGKHGDLHTKTCGCEDNPLVKVTD